MKVKKILIVPSNKTIQPIKNGAIINLLKIARNIKLKLNPSYFVYDGEMLFYSDIPKILGEKNVFVLDKYHPYLLSKKIPYNCPYPAFTSAPQTVFISKEEVNNIINEVDVVLVSTRAGNRGKLVIEEARRREIPIALIDFHDHDEIFTSTSFEKDCFRGFVKGKDFNIYFKKDIPLGHKSDILFPLSPLPVRADSFKTLIMEKDIDIFYSGRSRTDLCQPDRGESIDIIKKNFKNLKILEHETRKTFPTRKKYWEYISRSNISISPSGRVWDSYRHCEIGLANKTALVAPRPYVETVGPALRDGVNSILYDIEVINGRAHLINKGEFVSKLKYYLNSPIELENLANKWTNDVKQGHTVYARSKYIIKTIENTL